ncbi:hypothetical protein SISNIDRAFT_418949, partial [Sistotremastrum niveocremeum HHB9708]
AGVTRCRKVTETVIKNGDKLSAGQFVVTQTNSRMPAALGKTVELLMFNPTDYSGVDHVLIQQARTGDNILPYGMPEIILLDQYFLCPIAAIECTVNVQHNCARRKCELSGTRVVRKEREDTNRTTPTVKHNCESDLVLNTGQMRDARWIETFTSPLLIPNLPQTVLQAVEREFAGLNLAS